MTMFESMLKRGQSAESLVMSWLIERGVIVLPTTPNFGLSERSPVIRSVHGLEVTAPDMLCCLQRYEGVDRFFVEVKSRSSFVWSSKQSDWAAGFKRDLYLQYKSAQVWMRMDVIVMFLVHESARGDVESPTGLYAVNLASMAPDREDGENVWWSVSSMVKKCEITDLLYTYHASTSTRADKVRAA